MAKIPKIAKGKKFKTIEKDAVAAPVKDIPWEGEEIAAESVTKIQDDRGDGRGVVLRFFDFGANPETFALHKPTAQELFNTHMRGMESLLWRDGLKPFTDAEPRLMFSKDKKNYRFIIPCVPIRGDLQNTNTLSQLLTNTKT